MNSKVAPCAGTSLWFRYKHLLPVPITLVAGIILTAIMTPYFLSPLIANIKKNDVRRTGGTCVSALRSIQSTIAGPPASVIVVGG